MSITGEIAQGALDYAREHGWAPKGEFAGCLVVAVRAAAAGEGIFDNIGLEYLATRYVIMKVINELYPLPTGEWTSQMTFYDDAGTTTDMVETVLEKVAVREGIA